MPLTPEQQQVIIDALGRVQRGTFVCPVSKDGFWTVEPYFTQLNATENPMGITIGGTGYPNVILICNTCGYTALFNLYRLGLAEYFGLPPAQAQNG